jgi:hypothetical protein
LTRDTRAPALARIQNAGAIETAALPAPKVMRDGESFDVDLHAEGHDRVYVRIRISTKRFPKERAPSKTVRSQDITSSRRSSRVDPSPRRTTLCARPDSVGQTRVARAGSVNGDVLEFTGNGRQFRVESDRRSRLLESTDLPISKASGMSGPGSSAGADRDGW